LYVKGFASPNNTILGVGSYTYQYVTRDTLGFAQKATAGVVNGELREIFKDPVSDTGMKKSAKGLLRVDKNAGGNYVLKDQCTFEEEQGGELKEIFRDGDLLRDWTLQEVRENVEEYLTSKA
jgi:nicotinamide phosphoribosyltransferase